MPVNRLLICALIALAGAPEASAQTPLAGSASGNSQLNPGDVLKVTVWRNDELSGEFKVGADSTLLHPLYSGVKVVGVPYAEVASRIRTLLAQYEANPEVVLQPQYNVYVGGDVAMPGMYMLGAEATVVRAIVEAGGAMNPRRLKRVRLVRNGESDVLDLTRQSGGPVRSGDQIFVEGNLVAHIIRDYITPASSVVTTGLFVFQFVKGLF